MVLSEKGGGGRGLKENVRFHIEIGHQYLDGGAIGYVVEVDRTSCDHFRMYTKFQLTPSSILLLRYGLAWMDIDSYANQVDYSKGLYEIIGCTISYIDTLVDTVMYYFA